MVSKEQIEVVLNNILGVGLEVKCGPTIAEMHTTLDKMSHDEKYTQLKEQGLLNPLEEQDYTRKLNAKEEYLSRIDNIQKKLDGGYWDEFDDKDDLVKSNEDTIKYYEHKIDEIDDVLFQYGRRLIEGYETEFPVNIDDYQDKAGQSDEHIKMWGVDEYGDEDYSYEITHNMGHIEEQTVANQQKSVKLKVDPNELVEDEWTGEEVPKVTDERLISMDNYFSGDTDHINHNISHEGYLSKLDDETKRNINNIDSLMEESTGLPYNTLLYRGGHFDINTRVGETIKFKGYQSTTFQQDVAVWYGGNTPQDRANFGNMLYLIHAPKGTKGIAGNDDRFNNGFLEHEYVLPRNTKMKVIRIDYEKMVCEVVIEE